MYRSTKERKPNTKQKEKMESLEPQHNCHVDSESFELVKMFENLTLDESNNKSIAVTDGDSKVDMKTSKTSSQEDDTGSDGSIIVLSQTAQSFRALGKIVNFMRKRYQSGGETQPLTLDEILEKTKQADLSTKIREWLTTEALCNNKRIEVSENGRYYKFKPAYKLNNIGDLIELLKENERKGLGGVLIDDIRDSLPNYRQVLKDCDAHILILKRPFDRKSIVYYIDHETPAATDIELQAMWRSLGLEDIEEVYEPSEDNGRY